jgi:hypothetical protein
MKEVQENGSMSLLSHSALQNNVSNVSSCIGREVYFRSGKIISVNVNLFRGSKRNVKAESIRNLELKGQSLGIKAGSVSKIEKMLTAWIKALYYSYDQSLRFKKSFARRAVFLTLTLPAQQMHSDTEIKRKCLMPFLQYLQYHNAVRYYFWKAEVQKNSNIHFHVIIDHFIEKKRIQVEWNEYLQRLGYIDRFEEKYNHRNPPTTHIEVIDSMDKAVSYVLKYVNKDVEGRNIEGQKWNCSKDLRVFKLQSYVEDTDMCKYLDYLVRNDKCRAFNDEYFAVYVFTKKFNYSKDYQFIEQLERFDCLKRFDEMYKMTATPVFNVSTDKRDIPKKVVQLSLFSDADTRTIDWSANTTHFF